MKALTLVILTVGSSGLISNADAETLVKKFPPGSAEDVLKNTQDPNWEAPPPPPGTTGVVRDCVDVDARVVGRDDPNMRVCRPTTKGVGKADRPDTPPASPRAAGE